MIEADLLTSLEEVKDRASFLDFIHALIDNRTSYLKHDGSDKTDDWANDTIESYLDSAAACMSDHGDDGLFLEEPSWKVLAEFLYCGKIYE